MPFTSKAPELGPDEIIDVSTSTYSNDPAKRKFYEELVTFLHKRGTPLLKWPNLGGKELDLHLLYTSAIARGGSEQVTKNKGWRGLSRLHNLPKTCTSAAFGIKAHYYRILYSYERVFQLKLPDRVEEEERPRVPSSRASSTASLSSPSAPLTPAMRKSAKANAMPPQSPQQPAFAHVSDAVSSTTHTYSSMHLPSPSVQRGPVKKSYPNMFERMFRAFESKDFGEQMWALDMLLEMVSATDQELHIKGVPHLLDYLYYLVADLVSKMSGGSSSQPQTDGEEVAALPPRTIFNHTGIEEQKQEDMCSIVLEILRHIAAVPENQNIIGGHANWRVALQVFVGCPSSNWALLAVDILASTCKCLRILEEDRQPLVQCVLAMVKQTLRYNLRQSAMELVSQLMQRDDMEEHVVAVLESFDTDILRMLGDDTTPELQECTLELVYKIAQLQSSDLFVKLVTSGKLIRPLIRIYASFERRSSRSRHGYYSDMMTKVAKILYQVSQNEDLTTYLKPIEPELALLSSKGKSGGGILAVVLYATLT